MYHDEPEPDDSPSFAYGAVALLALVAAARSED